ncbi:MAG: sensor histidine kinase [Anaerolineales bacterium]|nr:sensor histidine kinase [Anaerolineales bacterium]
MRRKRTDVIRIFRYFTGIAMLYFAALSLFTAWQTGEIINLSQIQSYVNLAINGILFGYLSWSWLENKISRYYLPLALVAATILPLFTNLIYLADPMESAQMTITRNWFLFPILIVPLVLIAWQYRFRIVLAFIFLTTIIELSILVPRLKFINYETLPILGLPLIRAFAFGTVGHVVTRLIATQREQQRKLVEANIKLNEHANALEQLTLSRERNRLARDLHDTLAHTLSGLTVNLEAIKILLGKDHPQIMTRLDNALDKTRTGLRDTRRALKDLRVKQVEDLGIKLALENLGNQASARGQFEIEIILPETIPESSLPFEQVYYRIAQEALENIVKHARASQVTLTLEVDDSVISLKIEDNGTGFETLEERSLDTLGIQGMQERAAECGGELSVTSEPEKGTCIIIETELSHVQNFDMR